MPLTFSYSISRDYTYGPWFPWATVAGGLLFTVLFTVFNVATTGYQMR